MDSSILYFILLILITLVLYIVPFVPAWYEWKYKTDAEPFRVNFQDRTLVDYDIRLFKEYISSNFFDILQNYRDTGSVASRSQIKDFSYYLTANSEILELEGEDIATQKTNKVILILEEGGLPNHCHFTNKVYSSGSLYTGNNDKLREIYAEKDILLAPDTTVQKLVYARGSIIARENITLNGYTKAEKKIQFLGSAKFQYLYASAIEFESKEPMPSRKVADIIGANLPRKIKKIAYTLPPNSEVMSHFLIKGSFSISAKCKIVGNIKSYQDIKIGENTIIFGAIFSNKSIFISDSCFIQGPIVASHSIYIGHNCFIGSSDSKTSIIAQYIHISTGCYTTGQILAKIRGVYLASEIK